MIILKAVYLLQFFNFALNAVFNLMQICWWSA
jgi:hypothetical protein